MFGIDEKTSSEELLKRCPEAFKHPENEWGELAFTMIRVRDGVAEQHPEWPWRDQDLRIRRFVFIRNLVRSTTYCNYSSRMAVARWLLSLTFHYPIKIE